ncbi:MAG: hypothetical protein MUD04_05310 [Cyanobium sp. Prado107]|jgi:hypothetical protein|nr:hypothetical protein [Cyanobium sp. Prado107]
MSLSPEILQQRYATIERLYSEREWPQVEALGEALLRDLPADPADPVRLRVELLLGHTRLYGMGVVNDARARYQTVLEHCSEVTLREIAEQGLQQCLQVEQGNNPEPAGNAPGQPSTAAMPWMEELAVEVVDEPEQLDVAQSDPGRRQELELRELGALSGAAAQTTRVADPLAFDPTRLSARELEELTRGLLRVRLT